MSIFSPKSIIYAINVFGTFVMSTYLRILLMYFKLLFDIKCVNELTQLDTFNK